MSQVDPVALLDTVLDAIESGDEGDVRAAARLARMAYPKGSTLVGNDFATRLKGHEFYRDAGNRQCVLVPHGQTFDIAEWDTRTTGDWYPGFEITDDDRDILSLLAGDLEAVYGPLLTYDELVAKYAAP